MPVASTSGNGCCVHFSSITQCSNFKSWAWSKLMHLLPLAPLQPFCFMIDHPTTCHNITVWMSFIWRPKAAPNMVIYHFGVSSMMFFCIAPVFIFLLHLHFCCTCVCISASIAIKIAIARKFGHFSMACWVTSNQSKLSMWQYLWTLVHSPSGAFQTMIISTHQNNHLVKQIKFCVCNEAF